jgi:hypothetical protein
MRMLACYEDILKDKNRSLSRHASVFDFFKSYSGSRPLTAVFLDIAGDDPDIPHRVQKEEPFS